MSKSLKEYVFSALRALLEPVVKMMLRNGVTYKEFCTLSKQVFVEVASEEYGIGGRPTNVSRIALITGIDRKEIKRIKDLLEEDKLAFEVREGQDRLTRVLSAWHQDEEYLDADGNPLALPMDGAEEEQASFTSLAKRYGGDVPTSALFKELQRGNVVEQKEDGKLYVLQRYFFPEKSDPKAFVRAGDVVHDIGSTLFHNLYGCDIKKGETLYFERRASNPNIDPDVVGEFQAFLDREGQAFLEKADAWLSENELKSDSDAKIKKDLKPIRLGVGSYMIKSEQLDD